MFELRCLGEATLRNPTGQLVHFRSRKHFALLAYLALNADRAHRRERLAGLLWSDGEDSRARHSLSQALYAVRRLLAGAVRIEGEDLELRPEGLQVDAIELERRLQSGDAGAAADLYKGDFLEGFWVRGALGFEEWAGRERARVAALARDALRRSIKSTRDRCEWPEVRQRAERLVQLDPFDETAHAELMRALWMLGDRAEALDRYDDLQRIFAAELQSSPSRETQALAERIRQRPVRGGWSSHRLLRESQCEILHDPPFVGRKRELAVLAKEWDGVQTGETRAVALVGPAGIGKTRLANEFINSLTLNNVTVLRGQCFEAEQTLPYGPIAEAFRQGIGSIDLSEVNPLWLAELARIVPEVHDRYGELPEPAVLDAEGGRRRLYEGLAQVLRAACEAQPVLLFVDDVHWADDSSVALLHYLGRRVTNGLYLLTAHRPEEIGSGESSSAASLFSDRKTKVRVIHLEGLDHSASSDLLVTLMGEGPGSSSLTSVQEMSAGNPYFAIELARNLAEEGEKELAALPVIPESIRALLERRFAGLAERSIAVMQQAACIGTRFSYDALNAAVGLAPVELHGVLRELARCRIVMQEDDVIRFQHDLVREVAWSRVPAALHSALHLRAARALMSVGGSDGEVARHLSLGGDVRRAHALAIRGADKAERVFALEEAAELLELAIKHAPSESKRMKLVGRLGKVHLHMRNYAEARPLLKQRLDYVRQHGTSKLKEFEARSDLLFVDVYSSTLTVQESGRELKRLYTELTTSGFGNSVLGAEILTKLFWAAARSLDPILAEETIRAIRELHEHNNDPAILCRTGRSLGIYECYKGHPEVAERTLREAIVVAQEARDQAAVVDCYVGLTTILPRVVRPSLADSILQEALPLATQHADPWHVAALYCNCAVSHKHSRDLERAETLLRHALQTLETSGVVPDTSPSIQYNLGSVAFRRRHYDEAESRWTRALETSKRVGVVAIEQECLASLGLLYLCRGKVSQAREYAAQALRLARRGRFLVDERSGLEELLARLRYTSGHSEKALCQLARTAELSRTTDIPLHLTAQLARLALLAQEGRRREAESIAEHLVATARSNGATWWIEAAEQLIDTTR